MPSFNNQITENTDLPNIDINKNTKNITKTGNNKYLGTKLSLRGHSSSITNIQDFYIPSTFSFTDPTLKSSSSDTSISYQLLETTLISGDESGWIIWWDLNTRRPIGSWKAHDGPILSIIQTGLTWVKIPDNDNVVPKIDSIQFGKLLTHGRDGEIKIWNIFDFIKSKNGSGFIWKISCPLQRKIFSHGDNITKWPKPKIVYEMPVNMLNFSNVDLINNILITPGTQDPNTFDIYDIYSTDLGNYKLTRLFKAIDPLEIIKNNHLKSYIRQTSNSNSNSITNTKTSAPFDSTQKSFGVIMKISWIESNLYAVGYESGDTITYLIKNDTINITSINSFHYPNPVLSLKYDLLNEKLLIGSASAKIAISTLKQIKSDQIDITEYTKFLNIKHKGISEISIRKKLIALLTWDGYSRFYNYDDYQILSFSFKVKSIKSSIQNSESSTSIDNSNGSEENGASVVCFNKPQLSFTYLKKSGVLQYDNGRSKNIIKHRTELALDSSWLFTGYKNGKISIQSVGI